MTSDFRKKRNHLPKKILFGIVGILILGVFSLLVVADINMRNKKAKFQAQIDSLGKKIQNAKDSNKNLQESISQMNDETYIEKVAREDLSLQKPGEKAFSFVREDQEKSTSRSAESQKNFLQNWLAWLGNIFGK